MDENTAKKQSVSGFKILGYSVKKSKDTEKIKLILEAEVDGISAANCNMGEIMKALLDHQVGDVDVGLSLFVDKK